MPDAARPGVARGFEEFAASAAQVEHRGGPGEAQYIVPLPAREYPLPVRENFRRIAASLR